MARHKSVPGCEVLSDSGTDMADPHLGLQSPKQPFRGIYYEIQSTWGPVSPNLSLHDSYWGHCKQAYIESYGAVFKRFFTEENN